MKGTSMLPFGAFLCALTFVISANADCVSVPVNLQLDSYNYKAKLNAIGSNCTPNQVKYASCSLRTVALQDAHVFF